MLVERHNLPIIATKVAVLSGGDHNPVDKSGLASFVADMLREGTKKRSAIQLGEDAEAIGATLNTEASFDAVSAELITLKENVVPAFDLLSDILLNPVFDGGEMERLRSRRLTSTIQRRDNPDLLRTQVIFHVLYGDNSAYGYDSLGTETSNRRISRDDLINFWQSGVTPSNTALVVSGDITLSNLRTLAENDFGKWKGETSTFGLPNTSGTVGSGIYIVDKPDSPQTWLALASVGASRSTPDYAPLEVMNNVFGGMFSSRINLYLRESHGYTYGVYSSFDFRRGAGPFLAGGLIRADVTVPATQELLEEVRKIRESEVSSAELDAAKSHWKQSLPGLFQTTGDVADSVAQLFIYGLPLDYYQNLPEKIDVVTAHDVERVAKKYLDRASMIVVAVGDRQKIEPELKELGFGPVKVVQ